MIAVRLTVVSLVAAGAWTCGTADYAIRTVRIYDVIKAFPHAVVQKPQMDADAETVGIRSVSIGATERQALFMHPTASAAFPPVVLGEDAVLRLSIGVADAVTDKPGDGVDFIVTLTLENGVAVKVFSRYVDPRARAEDRGWVAARVPLGEFAGQIVRVVLSTSPGPANNFEYDWAAWGQVELVLDPLPL
jgi:hypothetical protein